MHQLTLIAVAVTTFVVAAVGGLLWQTGAIPTLQATGEPSPNEQLPWPPKVGAPFPDLQLTSLDGQAVNLSRYRGKILILESIGMPCKACQAFSGGHELGGFGGVEPQPGLESFETYFNRLARGAKLSDDRLVFIQVLYYGPDGRRPPTLEEARQWAAHFRMTEAPNRRVLVATHDLISDETRAMIPGFHLVDHNFVLQCDAGNPPRQDVYRDLLPMMPVLFQEMPSR